MSDDATRRDECLARVEARVARRFGAPPRKVEEIPAGLGKRRFFRVWLEPGRESPQGTIVARVEHEEDPALRPDGILPEPALEPLRSVLEEAGLPVVGSYDRQNDQQNGVALLEDVGDTSLEAAVAAGLSNAALEARYREACRSVPALQRIEARPDVPAFARHLDEALFRYKADQFVTWALPFSDAERAHQEGGPARQVRANEARVVRDAFTWIANVCETAPQRLAHRDYKAANLHLHARRANAPPELVMIDIQGAFLAPPEYDLVCLLRDSHVALPESLVERLLEETRVALPDAPSEDTFMKRFTLLTLTRNGKDLSRYLYAIQKRGDERYAPLLPRAVDTLKAAAALAAGWDSRLARLAEVIDQLPEIPCEQ